MRTGIIVLTFISLLSAFDGAVYDSLWTVLTSRHSSTLRYLDESMLSTKARREQLATRQTLSGGPTFTGAPDGLSAGDFVFGQSINWSHPRWSSSLFLQNSDDKLESGSVELKYSLLSDLNGRLEDLDTVIALTKKKTALQREALLFNDFKLLLSYKIQYDYYRAESEIRSAIEKRGAVFLKDLNKLVEIGIIARNATQSIQLFLRDNALRVKALELECELMIDNVFYSLEIGRTVFLGLDIENIQKKLSFDTQAVDYSWRMDSLNTMIQQAGLKEQNRRQWNLSVGAGTAFYDYKSPESYNHSVLLQFQVNFQKKVLPEDSPLVKRKAAPKSSFVKNDLDEYNVAAQEYSESAGEWINSTLKRMQLGEAGIIYELSQNLDIIINNQLKYYTLLANYQRRQFSQFRSLSQLSEEMRPSL